MKNKFKIFARGGALGDFILSMPLLKTFCDSESPVVLITRKKYLDLVPSTWDINIFYDIDSLLAISFLSGRINGQKLSGAEIFFFNKRDESMENHLMKKGAEKVFWLNPRPDSPPHASLHFYQDAGLKTPENIMNFRISENLSTGSDLWLHPGSGSPSKNCPIPVFANFAETWQKENNGKIWISFGEADTNLIEPVKTEFSLRKINYEPVINPTLKELKELLLANARQYLGNDSGVSHLAGILGINSTVFFKSTNPEVWRPFGSCQIIIRQ